MATTVTYTNQCPCCTSGVTNDCCPSINISETLYATYSSATSGCVGCLTGSWTFSYDSGSQSWISTSQLCSNTVTLKCNGSTWDLTFSNGLSSVSLDLSSTCTPINLIFNVDGTMSATPCLGTFTLTITE